MQTNKTSRFHLGISFLCVAVLLVCSIFLYNFYINEKIESLIESTFEESISQQAFHFRSTLLAERESLETISNLIGLSQGIVEVDTPLLEELLKNTSFDSIAVMDPQGNAIYDTGDVTQLGDHSYFAEALKGKTVISEPIPSTLWGTDVMVMAVPIHAGDSIVGVIAGMQTIGQLNQLLSPSFGGEGYTYVVNNNGEVIASRLNKNALVTTNNIFDVLEDARLSKGVTTDTLQKNFQTDHSGQLRYTYRGETRIMKYTPIGLNGWNIVSIVPAQLITHNSIEITLATATVSAACIAFVLALILKLWFVQKKVFQQLSDIAYVDELTKAPTLAKFKMAAQECINANPEKIFVLSKFDIDKFKLINEAYGVETGDAVLTNIATALKENTAPAQDCFAHLHDDEFLVLHSCEYPHQILEYRQAFDQRLAALMGSAFQDSLRRVSGHYYMSLENCTSITEAIEKANIAHRKAKELGLEILVYDETFITDALRRKDIENKMRPALENGEFAVYLQPQHRLMDNSIGGAEALVRWIPKEGPMIYPNDFIPVFEQNRFILKLDFYMFEQTCKIIRGWLDRGVSPVPISVNFSRLHLTQANFVQTLCDLAGRYRVPHHLLAVELLESVMFDNEEVLLEILSQLHQNGFILAIDDFGTGYSSLGLLKNIPADIIKIDKRFFDQTENHQRSRTVLESVIRLANELNMQTVAEGVETAETVELLRQLGCHAVQGYYYTRPMPHTDFLTYMEKQTQNR